MGSLTEGKIEGRGRDFYPNHTVQMILINTANRGQYGSDSAWPTANCEGTESLTPCLPPTSETTRQDGCNLQCVIFVYSGKMI